MKHTSRNNSIINLLSNFSTMSTGLNSMTGVIYQDLIRPLIKRPVSEAASSFTMKVIAFIIGFLCVGLVFIVEKLGALIQVSVIICLFSTPNMTVDKVKWNLLCGPRLGRAWEASRPGHYLGSSLLGCSFPGPMRR